MFQNRRNRTLLDNTPINKKHFLKRALMLSAGILLLWAALHIMPRPGESIQASEASSGLTPVATTESPSSSTAYFLKTSQLIAGLLLMALIGYSFFHFKKKAKERPSIKSMSSLSRLQLGANQHVHLIQCGDDTFLIGTTSSQITLLQQVPLSSLLEGIDTYTSSPPPSYSFSTPTSTSSNSGDFAAILNTMTSSPSNSLSHDPR